ncbi:hypothetical protein ACFW2V_02625 [Streptomyces sp. NPDC058947]|uniref:hypothetical protein n=1 Tax=Streptomyces sp. NPDC058947 TaxID=3346675 RepID=UPI0036BBC8FD
MADGNNTTLLLPAGDVEKYVASFPPPTITISGEDGSPLVKIHPDGTLEYGPDYDPDEAARRFWEATRIHMPTRCANYGDVGAPEATQ